MAASEWLDYTHALVRALPASFPDSLKLHPPPEPIDMSKAHTQHDLYTDLIRQLVPNVLDVPADEQCPDCVFIEDTVLAVGSTLVLTHPGAPERRPEVTGVQQAMTHLVALMANDGAHEAVRGKVLTDSITSAAPACHNGHASAARMHHLQAPALLDGGDVMFDGSCLWVGITQRTNAAAMEQLKGVLSGQGVVVVGLPVVDPAGSTLHLKSLVSAIDAHHILAADNAAGKALVGKALDDSQLASSWAAAGRQLRVTYVPDQLCANVLRIGRHVVMQQGFPHSECIIKAVCDELGLQLHTLDMSELAKADGALTCCSVLMRLPGHSSHIVT